MNIKRLVISGFVGFFLVLAVTSGLAVSNSEAADGNQPLPVRAPLPTQAPARTTPAAPGENATQLVPEPQPVPVPPTAAATEIGLTQVDSGSVSLIPLLLAAAVIGALIGLIVLGKGWQAANGRFLHLSTVAQGGQS